MQLKNGWENIIYQLGKVIFHLIQKKNGINYNMQLVSLTLTRCSRTEFPIKFPMGIELHGLIELVRRPQY